MVNQTDVTVSGGSLGIAVGILVAYCVCIVIYFCRKQSFVQYSSDEVTAASLPNYIGDFGANLDSSASITISEVGHGLQHVGKTRAYLCRRGHQSKDLLNSLSGVPKYLYKDIQKATQNFTTVLGVGSFGPVYKAIMPTSEVVAVKVLANDSQQGEKEFQTEVMLLSRLHHRNLVNMIGYCVDKGKHILIYEFMSNGNLANLLYGDGPRKLNWEERLQIALDVSHGIEYLHEGAFPPVVHRDLKSANILLDKSVMAKVADFGLSKEEVFDGRNSGLKGTYGYMDPSYTSTGNCTKKSDIYSFGIILFELITAIHPQHGLTDYINLAKIGEDGKADWDEIIDNKLLDDSNIEEIRQLADIGYWCLHKIPMKRPSITDVTQAISKIQREHLNKEETSSIRERLVSYEGDEASAIKAQSRF